MLKRKSGKENSKYYMLCFYPFFGAIIGALMYAFNMLCLNFGFGQACFALVGTVIPVLLGGVSHLKEFMKTTDKLCAADDSYGVIVGILYCMLYAGGLVIIWKDRQLVLLGIGYMISRALYSMAYVWFAEAKTEKKDGKALSAIQKQTLRIILSIILALCFCTCIAVSPIMGVLEALLCMWIWTYYYYLSKRVCGGITRELSGYFLTLCELVVVLFVGMFGRVLL